MDGAGSSSDDDKEIEGIDEAERRRERPVDPVPARFDALEPDIDEKVRFCPYSSLWLESVGRRRFSRRLL
jgi:hypothetical protein